MSSQHLQIPLWYMLCCTNCFQMRLDLIDTRCMAMPSVMAACWVGQCRHLANATELLTPVLWTMAGGWVRTPVLFLAIWGQSTPKSVCLCGSVHSLQCRFPIDDVLLHSRDIRDQVKLCKIAPKFHVFRPLNQASLKLLKLRTSNLACMFPGTVWTWPLKNFSKRGRL